METEMSVKGKFPWEKVAAHSKHADQETGTMHSLGTIYRAKVPQKCIGSA
jgi:hypothetical protein